VSICECCDHELNNRSDTDCKSTECPNDFRSNSSDSQNHEQYDSDFDVENFDSIVEHEVSHVSDGLQEDDAIVQNTNHSDHDSDHDNDCEYETIGQNENQLQTSSLTVKDIDSSDYVQNKDSNVSSTPEDFTKACYEKSKQCLAHV